MFNVARCSQVWVLAVVAVQAAYCSAEETKVDPQVQALMDKHLRLDPSYVPGDILSRKEVEPIYNDLISRGLQPTREAESAYTPILRDTHFLVMLLRTPQGRAFMRKIADKPSAYDQLDRLSWLPGGQVWVQQIVAANVEGVKLLDQLFSDAGIEALKKQFGDAVQAEDLRRPTGKLYTEAALGASLTQSLRRQMQTKANAGAARRSSQDAKRSTTSSGGTTAKRSNGA